MRKFTLCFLAAAVNLAVAQPTTVKEYAQSLKNQQAAVNAGCENDLTPSKAPGASRAAIKLYCACYSDNIVNNDVLVRKIFEVIKTATSEQEYVAKMEAVAAEARKICQSKLTVPAAAGTSRASPENLPAALKKNK